MLKLHRDKVSSVGVVDANNRLIGVISASDIKAIGSTAANYHMLYSQCSTFLDQRGAQAEVRNQRSAAFAVADKIWSS
jgi:Mg/Co/Ni transporter MgtE